MLRTNRKMSVAFTIVIIFAVVSGCGESSSPVEPDKVVSPFASFKEIPGVTADEIAAIEALQKKYSSFIYGMPPTAESFLDTRNKGEIRGFSALFCEWLTGIFQINFHPAFYAWSDLIAGLEQRDIDFTGDLMATEERRAGYFMTDAIAERSLSVFRMSDAPPLPLIAASHPLRLAFLRDSAAFAPVATVMEQPFEAVFVNDFQAAYEVLSSGNADAFLSVGISEASFLSYGNVTSETFFPLIYNAVSLSTKNPEFIPIINVVQKALRHSGTHIYLSNLYQTGHDEYRRHKLFTQLSSDELAYIENNKVIKFAAEIDNYPISFYNTHEHEWQGVAHEVLVEVEKLTGLHFEIANLPDAPWSVVLGMMERGEVALISEMLRTDEQEGRFLWPETAIMEERAVLLSRIEYPNIEINEVLNVRVGVIRNSVYAELFRRWFPNHDDIWEYNSIDDLLDALESGEIEMMMGRTNQFLNMINYREILDYKINVIFNSFFESSFALHKDETILCSILDKSLKMIDTESIALNWTYRAYDYRYKLLEARLPWLIGAIVMSLIVLALILVMFFRSRNDRRRLAKLVAEETSTLTAIFNSTPDQIFCKDLNSQYTRYNKSFQDYYRLRKSVLGKFDSEALGFPPHIAVQHKSMDKKVFTERETVVSEEFVSAPDGKNALFEVIKSPLLQDGKVTGLVAMARDITRRKAAEDEANRASEEAIKAYAEAKNASEAKSHFVANMSHEMRTPINLIVGLTDLLLEEDEPINLKETLNKINTAGNTLMGLINDVLDISKIEAGKMDLMPVQYDVAGLLNDIITLNMIRIENKPVIFKLDINENLPADLFGDDLRVKQILNNLLSNAFKYTNKGSVTLGVDNQRYDRQGNDIWISFYVSDTGIGIHKEDIEKLFADYNHVNTQISHEIEGTGLGLSITKKFVEMMDGEISVESEYGKGSTFRVRIRQGFVSDKTIGKEVTENLRSFSYLDKKKQEQKRLLRSDLSYARVLVVDDFHTNLDVAVGMLRKYKMHVDCADNGQTAIDYIAAGEPVYDAVFMDHMMPVMDGIEATKKIRALGTKYAENLPIIALITNAAAGNEHMFLENGFNAFLQKPFNVMLLNSIVQRWVRDNTKE